MPPAEFVLLPRDLPWERAYDREDANAPQIAKLRLALPADYPAGTVLKLPMPCACSEHTSRFTKIKAGTSVVIKWDLGICGLAAPPGADGAAAGGAEVAEATEAARPPPAGLEKGVELALAEPADATAQLNSELSSSELIRSERSSTGFKGVYKVSSGATPFGVQVYRKGISVILGRYATAEEAALRYARSVEGKAELAARSAARSAPQASTAPRKRQKVETAVGAGGAATSASAATSHSAAASSTAAASAAEFEVDRILSERRRPSGGVEYLVAWKGYYAPSWEPASNLADEDGAVCAALLAWCASRVAPHQGGPATELGMPAAEPLPPLGMPAVVQALEGVGLGRYAAAFEEQGYDDLRYLRTMDAAERATVAESVGMKQGHADKFVKFAFEPA